MNDKQSIINNKQHDQVLEKADAFTHSVYSITWKLPNQEKFGLTSQLKRASLSVPLNIVEGYARQSKKMEAQFLTIAYGSLKEALFILNFAVKEGYFTQKDIGEATDLGSQAGKLIWAKTQTLRRQVNK